MMKKRLRNRKEATFLEHLEELRYRLIRCIAYVAVATALCWFARQTLMDLALAPLLRAGEMCGLDVEVKIFEVAGGLILSMHVALVAGIILASPGWLLEGWLFIEPALDDHERKWVVALLPAAVGLFLGGVGFCYWLSPRAFAVLLRFQKDLGADPEFMLKNYLTFFLRLLLIFGVMFELPLVIMFLSAVGIVSSEFLAKHWRIAVVIIAVVCAIATPTPDAVTLSFLAGPMIGLYLLSILLAKFVEKGRRKRDEEEPDEPGPPDSPDDPTPEETPEPEEPPGEDPYAAYDESESPETEAAPAEDTPEPTEELYDAHAAQQEPDEEALRKGGMPESDDPEEFHEQPWSEADTESSEDEPLPSRDDPPTDDEPPKGEGAD